MTPRCKGRLAKTFFLFGGADGPRVLRLHFTVQVQISALLHELGLSPKSRILL
jgi:hypothetical protein